MKVHIHFVWGIMLILEKREIEDINKRIKRK